MRQHILDAEERATYTPAHTMTREQWQQLLQTKKDFNSRKINSLQGCSGLPPEVAESWYRSRDYRVDPSKPFSGCTISQSDLQETLRNNSQVIRIAAPLFKSFRKTRHCSKFYLHLLDKNGVILLQEGSLYKNYVNKTRTIFREDTLGTSASVLCNRLKQPVTLLGPQHYNNFINDAVVMAAPIFDSSGEVLYDLIFSLPLAVHPWEKIYPEVYSPTYSLIVAMAASIGEKLEQQKSHDYLQLIGKHYELTSLSHKNSSNTGIITIDRIGKILKASAGVQEIIQVEEGMFLDKNIPEIAAGKLNILNLINSGKASRSSETLHFGEAKQPYLLNVHPVRNQWSQKTLGAVLTLDAEKNTPIYLESRKNSNMAFSQLIGESPSFQKAISLGQAFGNSSDNILLTGESGTGKELFAQAIHHSYCPDGPFVAINCAAMPRELIESELFGYDRGSFTGADRCGRPGKIELADNGTLFLDEIGDMNLNLQAVLLRVLQDKQVVRVGGRHAKTVNFRLIAATNRNLAEQVREHRFREDLFYRLSVLTINLPPLRKREEDIPLLCRHFVKSYCSRNGIVEPQIKPEAQEWLNAYTWPGNIRQLQNAIIYAINSAQGKDIIGIRNLPESIIHDENLHVPEPAKAEETACTEVTTIRDSAKQTIMRALAETQYNVVQAAGILGISKSTLYRKIKRYKIQF